MVEIVPAIIAKDFNELHGKIKKVEHFVDWIQLDIMDGKFVPNKTWNNPQELKAESRKLKAALEAHLMIEKPWEHINEWIKSGAKRIIIHFESFRGNLDKILDVINNIKNSSLRPAMAINLETSWQALKPYMDKLDEVLVMTNNPGFGGQEFLPEVLPKIKKIRKKYPNINIGVDIGVNPATARQAVEAGANILVSGSFIYKHAKGVKAAIRQLRQNID